MPAARKQKTPLEDADGNMRPGSKDVSTQKERYSVYQQSQQLSANGQHTTTGSSTAIANSNTSNQNQMSMSSTHSGSFNKSSTSKMKTPLDDSIIKVVNSAEIKELIQWGARRLQVHNTNANGQSNSSSGGGQMQPHTRNHILNTIGDLVCEAAKLSWQRMVKEQKINQVQLQQHQVQQQQGQYVNSFGTQANFSQFNNGDQVEFPSSCWKRPNSRPASRDPNAMLNQTRRFWSPPNCQFNSNIEPPSASKLSSRSRPGTGSKRSLSNRPLPDLDLLDQVSLSASPNPNRYTGNRSLSPYSCGNRGGNHSLQASPYWQSMSPHLGGANGNQDFLYGNMQQQSPNTLIDTTLQKENEFLNTQNKDLRDTLVKLRQAYFKELTEMREKARENLNRMDNDAMTWLYELLHVEEPIMFFEPTDFVLEDETKDFIKDTVEEKMKLLLLKGWKWGDGDKALREALDKIWWLEWELWEMRWEMDELRASNSKLKMWLNEAEGNGKGSKEKMEKMEKELEDLKEELWGYREREDEFKLRIQELEEAERVYKQQLEEKDCEIERLRNDLAAKDEEIAELKTEIENLGAGSAEEIEKLNAVISEQEEKIKQMEREMEKLRKGGEVYEKEIASLKDQIKDLQMQIAKQKLQIQSLTEENQSLQQQVVDAQARPETSEQQTQTIIKEFKHLDSQTDVSGDPPPPPKVEPPAPKVKDLSKEYGELQEKHKVLKVDHKELQDKYDDLQRKFEEFIQQMKDRFGEDAVNEKMGDLLEGIADIGMDLAPKIRVFERLYADAVRREKDKVKKIQDWFEERMLELMRKELTRIWKRVDENLDADKKVETEKIWKEHIEKLQNKVAYSFYTMSLGASQWGGLGDAGDGIFDSTNSLGNSQSINRPPSPQSMANAQMFARSLSIFDANTRRFQIGEFGDQIESLEYGQGQQLQQRHDAQEYLQYQNQNGNVMSFQEFQRHQKLKQHHTKHLGGLQHVGGYGRKSRSLSPHEGKWGRSRSLSDGMTTDQQHNNRWFMQYENASQYRDQQWNLKITGGKPANFSPDQSQSLTGWFLKMQDENDQNQEIQKSSSQSPTGGSTNQHPIQFPTEYKFGNPHPEIKHELSLRAETPPIVVSNSFGAAKGASQYQHHDFLRPNTANSTGAVSAVTTNSQWIQQQQHQQNLQCQSDWNSQGVNNIPKGISNASSSNQSQAGDAQSVTTQATQHQLQQTNCNQYHQQYYKPHHNHNRQNSRQGNRKDLFVNGSKAHHGDAEVPPSMTSTKAPSLVSPTDSNDSCSLLPRTPGTTVGNQTPNTNGIGNNMDNIKLKLVNVNSAGESTTSLDELMWKENQGQPQAQDPPQAQPQEVKDIKKELLQGQNQQKSDSQNQQSTTFSYSSGNMGYTQINATPWSYQQQFQQHLQNQNKQMASNSMTLGNSGIMGKATFPQSNSNSNANPSPDTSPKKSSNYAISGGFQSGATTACTTRANSRPGTTPSNTRSRQVHTGSAIIAGSGNSNFASSPSIPSLTQHQQYNNSLSMNNQQQAYNVTVSGMKNQYNLVQNQSNKPKHSTKFHDASLIFGDQSDPNSNQLMNGALTQSSFWNSGSANNINSSLARSKQTPGQSQIIGGAGGQARALWQQQHVAQFDNRNRMETQSLLLDDRQGQGRSGGGKRQDQQQQIDSRFGSRLGNR